MNADYPDFEAFCDQIRAAETYCSDTGLETHYISTSGDSIQYDHGTATINAVPFELKGPSAGRDHADWQYRRRTTAGDRANRQ